TFHNKSSSTVATITMIFQSPKKLISVAKAFSPAWFTNLSPARLFTTNPTRDESITLDPPTWPDDVARDEFWEKGAPISPQRRLKRCYGPNGSFHRSIQLKQLQANRAWNTYQKKRSRYEAQQARMKRLEELNKPVPLAELHVQAMQKLDDSTDPEDRIFLRELGNLRNQTDNLEKFARVAKMVESLEEYREQHRARVEYAMLSARKPHTVPSFSTFCRERRNRAVEEAAARKRQQSQREKPNKEEDSQGKEREEKERKEKERKRKKEEYEEQRAREREAGRMYMEKVRAQAYREEIRVALEQGRPPPDHLLHRQDLIQEVAQVVTETALYRQQEAALRAKNERERHFAWQQEARRRADELEARRRAEQEAQHYAEERARAFAELQARRQAKLAEERAAQEAEKQRREQEEAQRRRAEAAAREEEARRAREEARRTAEEEARRYQAQQEQANSVPQGLPSDQIFEVYDNKWAALRGTEVYSDITFAQFPWPVLYQISDIGGITLDSVRAFFAHRGTRGKAMKAEILKWHPDKFNNQLHQVHAEHMEQVREAGELVAKFLNNIMED
ncbi:hypothetical protein C0992_012221, partial [Termitomyces sp. T32_za158]